MSYTRTEVLELRPTLSSCRLPGTTWITLRQLGLCATPPTRRESLLGGQRRLLRRTPLQELATQNDNAIHHILVHIKSTRKTDRTVAFPNPSNIRPIPP